MTPIHGTGPKGAFELSGPPPTSDMTRELPASKTRPRGTRSHNIIGTERLISANARKFNSLQRADLSQYAYIKYTNTIYAYFIHTYIG